MSPVRKRGVIEHQNHFQSPRMGAIEPRAIINRPAGALAFLESCFPGPHGPGQMLTGPLGLIPDARCSSGPKGHKRFAGAVRPR